MFKKDNLPQTPKSVVWKSQVHIVLFDNELLILL